jgi:hypothetical protein
MRPVPRSIIDLLSDGEDDAIDLLFRLNGLPNGEELIGHAVEMHLTGRLLVLAYEQVCHSDLRVLADKLNAHSADISVSRLAAQQQNQSQ